MTLRVAFCSALFECHYRDVGLGAGGRVFNGFAKNWYLQRKMNHCVCTETVQGLTEALNSRLENLLQFSLIIVNEGVARKSRNCGRFLRFTAKAVDSNTQCLFYHWIILTGRM